MRKAETATLVLRVRQDDGTRTYLPVVTHPNGKLKPHYAVHRGKPTHFVDSIYYLKSTRDGKRVTEHVGPDPALAVTKKLQREHELKSASLGLEVPVPKTSTRDEIPLKPGQTRHPIHTTLTKHIRDVEVQRNPRTAMAYQHTLGTFTKVVKRDYLEDITRDDVRAYIVAMSREGKSAKTIANRLVTVKAFLRKYGLDGSVVNQKDAPKVAKKLVATYKQSQVKALLEVCEPDDKLVWEFFLASGCREQEVEYLCWPDLDFESNMLNIHAKADLGFQLKDFEERSVPLPSSLILRLKARKAANPKTRLVFPARNGRPEGHFLRKLKEIAFAAGLNCGHCKNRVGVSCVKEPVCSKWQLHSFRRTAATRWSENGISLQTIQHWLGHSDIQTTSRYLGLQDSKSPEMRGKIDTAFASFGS